MDPTLKPPQPSSCPQTKPHLKASASALIIGSCFITILAAGAADTLEVAEAMPKAGAATVATYVDGIVTEATFASWRHYLRLLRRKASREEAIEDLVVVRVLASRFPESDPELERKLAEGVTDRRRQLAQKQIRQALRSEVTVTPAEVRKAYKDHPERYQRTARWRLSNIFRRLEKGASEQRWEEARRELEEIRSRVAEGASFAELAEAFSDSQTRRRRGDLGYVFLDRLEPVVAQAVSQLEVGDLSPVITSTEGVTLLQCTARLEAQDISFAKVQKQLEGQLRKRRFETQLEALEERLTQSMKLRWVETADWADPRAVLAKAGPKKSRWGITGAELQRDLENRGSRVPLQDLDRIERQAHLQEFVLRRAYLREAERRGLLHREDAEIQIRFRELELRAQLAINRLTEGRLDLPGVDVLRQRFAVRREAWIAPEAWHLRAILVPKDAGLGREYLRNLRQQGLRLAEEGGAFETVAASLAPHATTKDYGWLEADQLWTLGLNINEEARALEPGAWSPLVQQNATLYLLFLQAKREERPLPFEEVRPRLEAIALRAQRQRIGKAIRAEIIEKQRIERPADLDTEKSAP